MQGLGHPTVVDKGLRLLPARFKSIAVARKKAILLAEDNPNDALFFELALEKSGRNHSLEVLYEGELLPDPSQNLEAAQLPRLLKRTRDRPLSPPPRTGNEPDD